MSTFDFVAQTRQQAALDGAWAAVIAADATTAGDLVPVLLVGSAPTLKFGPCRWQPRPAALSTVSPDAVTAIGDATTLDELKTAVAAALELVLLPKAGDACLVVFDSQGDPWITAWWPA